MTVLRGIRGAIDVPADEPSLIASATVRLLSEIVSANRVRVEDIAAVFFTLTPDLNTAFPAEAARLHLGWNRVPMLSSTEVAVPGAPPRLIRTLVLAQTGLGQDEIRHAYLGAAALLRPDLARNGALPGTGEDDPEKGPAGRSPEAPLLGFRPDPLWRVAIDGPAASGKSTTARTLANRLGFLHIDTGAMYRALTWKALSTGVDPADAPALSSLAAETEIGFLRRPDGTLAVFCDGRDVSQEIRAPDVSRAVSQVASVPGVRSWLRHRQRRLAAPGGVVMDGRDIGTNVLPDADFKFFLTAALAERARRRAGELAAQGTVFPLDAVEAELAHRDRLDSEREAAPLRQADDAVLIDSTDKTLDEVVEAMLAVMRRGKR